MKKQGKDLKKLCIVIETLAKGEQLNNKYNDYQLLDDKFYHNCRESHITSDWLLVYKYENEALVLLLLATGSHSELF
ncbi:MAG: type II toxin-antitoxin system YafQ family toxin [Bacilli bacterium]|nr:type II toxin-antitoxin system YafQ family toxin [Bacilli bacterium]